MEDNNLLRRESEERFSNVVWTISEKYSIENKVMIAPKETTVVSLVHDIDESGYLRSSQLTYQNGNKNKKYVMYFTYLHTN